MERENRYSTSESKGTHLKSIELLAPTPTTATRAPLSSADNGGIVVVVVVAVAARVRKAVECC